MQKEKENKMSFIKSIAAVPGYSDFFLSSERDYVLSKIYELEDVRYELEKRLDSINNELEQHERYQSELCDEIERRGWF
jgi:hypothetical protein